MRAIWKFRLVVCDEQWITLPRDSRILCVHEQSGAPHVWAECSPTAMPDVKRVIRMAGTGPLDGSPGKYLGTCFCGEFAWHVFDGGEVA